MLTDNHITYMPCGCAGCQAKSRARAAAEAAKCMRCSGRGGWHACDEECGCRECNWQTCGWCHGTGREAA